MTLFFDNGFPIHSQTISPTPDIATTNIPQNPSLLQASSPEQQMLQALAAIAWSSSAQSDGIVMNAQNGLSQVGLRSHSLHYYYLLLLPVLYLNWLPLVSIINYCEIPLNYNFTCYYGVLQKIMNFSTWPLHSQDCHH